MRSWNRCRASTATNGARIWRGSGGRPWTLLLIQCWRATLNALLAAAVVWTTVTTEVQLHPDNAVGDATSSGIQLAFYGLTVLCLLAAGWLILAIRGRQTAGRQPSA